MQRLKSQNERFHGLIGKLKLDRDEKKELVREVSAGRCTSSKDLTAHEMARAIDMLSGSFDARVAKMQAKARAIANDIGALKMKDGKVDYTALNTFILKTCKKPNLFQLDYKELVVCITALERWRDYRTKKMVNEALKTV
ncbi:hypothetical protein [Dyadobacter frigoris]|uniref:Uncharacterized protein n=1 Tax=Dyadobacter frigoris TaxID=2576211 RepID=A0A4U6D152_9BACT|nr:hypothetical protein [Dyadobacter frigoris]TKT89498.1 hypothetical protein FDK13_24455 [Dyadobacter frigoris]